MVHNWKPSEKKSPELVETVSEQDTFSPISNLSGEKYNILQYHVQAASGLMCEISHKLCDRPLNLSCH